MNDVSANRSSNRTGRIIGSIVLILIVLGIAGIEILYYRKVRPMSGSWIYAWIGPLMAGVGTWCLVFAVLLWIPVRRKKRYACILFLCALVPAIFTAVSHKDETILKISPDKKHLLVMDQDKQSGKVTVERTYFYILKKEKEQLPYTVEGKMKYQWLENDVCAVTYESTDGTVHQYLATYGDRGNGISYLDPLVAVTGHWTINDTNHAGWKLTIDKGTVTLENGSGQWQFEENDCVRFGTTAIALCKNGLPEWSLVLNEDCKINYDCLIAKGGTLTVCPVSMKKTAPLIFSCTDPKAEYSDTDPNLE